MSYVPPASLLHGLPLQEAECFGKPHHLAYYESGSVKSNRLDDCAYCKVCGKPATNSHHEPPLGMGSRNRLFVLETKFGVFALKPALIALCGSGTTGCHGKRHKQEFSLEWEWLEDSYAELWWNGYWLSHGIYPHAPELYELGKWVLK